MKKKRSGGLLAGILAIAACAAGLIFTGKISSSVLRTILSVLIAAVIVVLIISFLIIFLARSSSKEDRKTGTSSGKTALTPEQSKSLDTAHSQLVNARMTISRFKDPALCQAGNEALSSMDKVLKTLKEKPEKIQTSRQLFNYYIPTLEKVVTRYQRIEEGNVQDAQVPVKLKNYFNNVRDAMETLYEGLYDNDKLNVAVDMEAMTIAIKRDGLLDDEDFEVHTEEGEGVLGVSEGE